MIPQQFYYLLFKNNYSTPFLLGLLKGVCLSWAEPKPRTSIEQSSVSAYPPALPRAPQK